MKKKPRNERALRQIRLTLPVVVCFALVVNMANARLIEHHNLPSTIYYIVALLPGFLIIAVWVIWIRRKHGL
jgi:hypothetical protein